jgi:hypothetical protein
MKQIMIIFPTSFTFCILNLLTLMLVYAKNEDDLYISWEIALCPTIFFCLILIMETLVSLIKIDVN